MNKFFKLEERGTTVRKELIGGLTTFFTMSYIIFVNSGLLGQAGMDMTGVAVATCLSAIIGTILTAVLANVPFVQAPGMGLNAFFTFTVCFGMGYTWQQALAIVLISGILFLVIAVSPLRSKVIAAIPAPLKAAISAGIGLFITFIGLVDSGFVSFGGGVPALGPMNGSNLLFIIGLIITIVLVVLKVKGAIFLGILATAVVGLIPIFGTWDFSGYAGYNLASIGKISEVAFHFDFNLLANGSSVIALICAIMSFTMVDMFDTVGTLLGTAANAGMLDKDGNLPHGDRALIADAVATCTGACLGTSTVTTYVESASGIAEGARTGLSSLFAAGMFVLSLFLTPIFDLLSANAWYLYAITCPALIVVGFLMVKGVLKVAWDNLEEGIPCFLTLIMMPFAYSISEGIGFGIISWVIIKLVRGKAKEVSWLMYVLALLFVVKYVLTALL